MSFSEFLQEDSNWQEEALVACLYAKGSDGSQLALGSDLSLSCKQLLSSLEQLPPEWGRELSIDLIHRTEPPATVFVNSPFRPVSLRQAEVLRGWESELTALFSLFFSDEVVVFTNNIQRMKGASRDQFVLESADRELALCFERPPGAWGVCAFTLARALFDSHYRLSRDFRCFSPLYEFAFTFYCPGRVDIHGTKLFVSSTVLESEPCANSVSQPGIMQAFHLQAELRLFPVDTINAGRMILRSVPGVLVYNGKRVPVEVFVKCSQMSMYVMKEEHMTDEKKPEGMPLEVTIGNLEIPMTDFMRLRKGSVVRCEMPPRLHGYIALGSSDSARVMVTLNKEDIEIEIEEFTLNKE